MNIVILIPSYNSALTINETLTSVQNQVNGLEHISSVYLADDGSCDDTLKMARSVWCHSVPLRIITNEKNLGEYPNVNRAIEKLPEGVDWILILHSDDIAKPNWLVIMLERMFSCGDEVASICASWDDLYPNGRIEYGDNLPDEPVKLIEGSEEHIKGTLWKGCWWHISGCAIRTKVFKEVGGLRTKFSQTGDWDLLLRCLVKGWSIEYIPQTLIFYRQGAGNVSSNSFARDKDIIDSLQIIQDYAHLLSRIEVLSFHLKRIKYVVRRIGRAASRFEGRRCLLSSRTIWLISENCLKCLFGQGRAKRG